MDRFAVRADARPRGRAPSRTAASASRPASIKGRHDVVTAMDARGRAASSARRSRSAFPGDAMIGEEEGGGARASGCGSSTRSTAPRTTRAAFRTTASRSATWSAACRRSGAIYDPSHDWLYAAARGRGAWLDGARLAVSPCDDMTAATVECGWSTRRPAAGLRRRSSAGCWPRAGRCAGPAPARSGSSTSPPAASRATAELHINAWDCAAGIVLVREAGGFTNDFFAGDGACRPATR